MNSVWCCLGRAASSALKPCQSSFAARHPLFELHQASKACGTQRWAHNAVAHGIWKGPVAGLSPCMHSLSISAKKHSHASIGTSSNGSSVASHSRSFSTRNISGRLFYKRRPKFVPQFRFNWRSKWLEGAPCLKGVCTKVYITAPRKPNSGQRKVAYVRLSNGRIVKCYIPGIGHNLQVHSVVMVRGGRRRDIIGCNYTLMRGHYDLLPVKGRKSSRSKYGVARPNIEPKHKRVREVFTEMDRRMYRYRTGLTIPSRLIPGSEQKDPHFITVLNKKVEYRAKGQASLALRRTKKKSK